MHPHPVRAAVSSRVSPEAGETGGFFFFLFSFLKRVCGGGRGQGSGERDLPSLCVRAEFTGADDQHPGRVHPVQSHLRVQTEAGHQVLQVSAGLLPTLREKRKRLKDKLAKMVSSAKDKSPHQEAPPGRPAHTALPGPGKSETGAIKRDDPPDCVVNSAYVSLAGGGSSSPPTVAPASLL